MEHDIKADIYKEAHLTEYVSLHRIDYQKTIVSSDKTKEYVVSFGPSEYEIADTSDLPSHDWSCTCGDWQYRRKGRGGYCKHINIVKALDYSPKGRILWQGDSHSVQTHVSQDVWEQFKLMLDNSEAEDAAYMIYEAMKLIVPLEESYNTIVPVITLHDYKTAVGNHKHIRYEGTSLVPVTYAKYYTLIWLIQQIQDGGLGSNEGLATDMYFKLYAELKPLLDFSVPYTLLTTSLPDNGFCDDCKKLMTYLPPFSNSIASEQSVCANKDCAKSVNTDAVLASNLSRLSWGLKDISRLT